MKTVARASLSRSGVEFDGSEDEFIGAHFVLACPVCKAALESRPGSARSLYFESDAVRTAAAALRGAQVKPVMGTPTVFFADQRASAERVRCPSCGCALVLIWAAGETQPGRFRAVLKGAVIESA